MVFPLHPFLIAQEVVLLVVVHADLHVRRTGEDASAELDLVRTPVLGFVGAVGAQVDHVYVLEVGTVGQAGVVEHQVEVVVGVARPEHAVEIPEGDAAQLAVATESVEVDVV